MWRCLLSVALLAAPLAAPAFDEREALRRSQAAIGRPIGDYTLRDTESRPVRLADLRGKPLVVNFVYTGCFSICPVTTQFLGTAVAAAKEMTRDSSAGCAGSCSFLELS